VTLFRWVVCFQCLFEVATEDFHDINAFACGVLKHIVTSVKRMFTQLFLHMRRALGATMHKVVLNGNSILLLWKTHSQFILLLRPYCNICYGPSLASLRCSRRVCAKVTTYISSNNAYSLQTFLFRKTLGISQYQQKINYKLDELWLRRGCTF
jgi:hypothetical protein